jgi:peptide/nickel transport system substrate-binding protein
MNARRKTVIAALSALALALTACGGSGGSTSNSGSSSKAEFNAAMNKVFNASDKKGGTIKYADESAPDSVDPGDTYYGSQWDMIRNWGRSLTMFKVAPGDASNELVGDLADGLGKASDNAKTWTYKLRSGLKYEDGTPITSKDVKYAVERSTAKEVHPDGPAYFDTMLNWPAG